MQALDLAVAHKAAREQLTHSATTKALRLWSRMPLADLDAGWDVLAPQITAVAVAAQVQGAVQATRYARQVDSYYGVNVPAEIVPQAFAGVVLDGREIAPAMYGAVTTTKTLIGQGVAERQAFLAGASFLATVVGAAIQDMGRMSDLSLNAAKRRMRYVRVVSANACSRCAILAGKGSGAVAFKRHPRCKCGVWPVQGDSRVTPEGMFDSPEDFFASLTREQQDRTFTKAGAEAIRQGASPIKVVNARRGAYGITYNGGANAPAVDVRRLLPVDIGVRADGTRLRVFATAEGTTVRGQFGRAELQAGSAATKEGRYRRTTTLRLMPEQILRMAGGNPARARELLKRYGYLY